jgi:hypothetical protein
MLEDEVHVRIRALAQRVGVEVVVARVVGVGGEPALEGVDCGSPVLTLGGGHGLFDHRVPRLGRGITGGERRPASHGKG